MLSATSRTLAASSTPTVDSGSNGVNARNLSADFIAMDGPMVTTSSGSLAVPMAHDSNIAKLPRELLDQVTRLLPTLDFNNLRLTCKLLENKIFPYWSNTFFKKRQFMITPFSLQTLVDISHSTLGPCMTHLVIGLDEIKAIPVSRVSDPGDYAQCKLAADTQDSLLDTGLAVQLLTTALRNLRNLKNVDVRDFNSRTRYRDANSHQRLSRAGDNDPGIAWKSYGHSHLRAWSNFLNEEEMKRGLSVVTIQTHAFVTRVFKALVTALSQSGRHIRGLEVLSRLRHSALCDGAFAVSTILGMTNTKLASILSGLDKLHLDLEINRSRLPIRYHHPFGNVLSMPHSIQEFSDPATTNLKIFLGLTANLKWLRLNEIRFEEPAATLLLCWLALDPEKPFGTADEAGWSDSNPKPVSLPLRRLDLGGMAVDSDTLRLIVQKLNQLESLSLRNIKLYQPNHLQQAPAVTEYDVDDVDDFDAHVWARFFRKLPTLAPNLKHLHLKGLFQKSTLHGMSHQIVFGTPAGDGILQKKETDELTLTDKALLETLGDRTWTRQSWRAANPPDPFLDNDDSSDGDEDGEDDDSSESDGLDGADEDASEDDAD